MAAAAFDRRRRRRLRRRRRRGDAAARGLRGRHRLRARRACRRRVEPQHLSRRRLRRALAPLRVLVRAQPALVAPLRAAGRDPGLPRGRRAPQRRARPRAHGHRGDRRALGRGAREVAARDERGPARGRRAAHRLRPALGPQDAVDPGPRRASKVRCSTPPSGATTSTSPASRVARDRHRLQRDPDGAGDPAASWRSSTSTSARPAGRSPRWTSPTRERTQRLFERFPLLQRLDRMAIFAFMELGAARDDRRAPPARCAERSSQPSARSGAVRSRRRSTTPCCARKVTPRDEIGCKRIMLTDDWYPTLTKPNVELVTDAIAEVTPGGVRAVDGTERPADVLVLATGFETHAFVAPMEIVGAGGRTLAEEWAPVPRAYLGMSVPGFPEHVPALRTEHQRRHRLGDLHDRGRRRPRDRRARRARARRRATDRGAPRGRRGVRPRAARGARVAPSGTPAARAGTSTRTATTRTSGRGCGAPTDGGRHGSSREPTS